MILYGASGHAKVVEDMIERNGGTVSCFVDDNPSLQEMHGIAVVHRLPDSDEPVIIAIGDNATRYRLARRLKARFGMAIHPSAVIARRSAIAKGTVVMAGAVIQTDVNVGCHCIVNTVASIDHECQIGSFVHLSPRAVLCGNVHVGEGAWIGAGATVIQGVRIGKWAVVGAGTVVTSDVPDYALVIGNRDCIMKRDYYKNKVLKMLMEEESKP